MSRQNDYLYEGPLTERHIRTALRFADHPSKIHVGRDHYAEFVASILPLRNYTVGTPSDYSGGEVYFEYGPRERVLIEPDGQRGRIGVSA